MSNSRPNRIPSPTNQADEIPLYKDGMTPLGGEPMPEYGTTNTSNMLRQTVLAQNRVDPWLGETLLQDLKRAAAEDGFDYDEVIGQLVDLKARDAAQLVRFMRYRGKASDEEIEEDQGKERKGGSFRSFISRTNNYLYELRSRLYFERDDGNVVKKFFPKSPD